MVDAGLAKSEKNHRLLGPLSNSSTSPPLFSLVSRSGWARIRAYCDKPPPPGLCCPLSAPFVPSAHLILQRTLDTARLRRGRERTRQPRRALALHPPDRSVPFGNRMLAGLTSTRWTRLGIPAGYCQSETRRGALRNVLSCRSPLHLFRAIAFCRPLARCEKVKPLPAQVQYGSSMVSVRGLSSRAVAQTTGSVCPLVAPDLGLRIRSQQLALATASSPEYAPRPTLVTRGLGMRPSCQPRCGDVSDRRAFEAVHVSRRSRTSGSWKLHIPGNGARRRLIGEEFRSTLLSRTGCSGERREWCTQRWAAARGAGVLGAEGRTGWLGCLRKRDHSTLGSPEQAPGILAQWPGWHPLAGIGARWSDRSGQPRCSPALLLRVAEENPAEHWPVSESSCDRRRCGYPSRPGTRRSR